MRNQRNKQWLQPGRLGMASALGALILATSVFGKQAKAPQFPFPAVQKQMRDLHYPEFPKELQARIRGKASQSKPSQSATATLENRSVREWGLASIGFFDVFSKVAKPFQAPVNDCSQEVTVAVIDTGIDYTHPELQDNLWVNSGETGYWEPPKELADKGYAWNCRDKSCNGIDDDGNGYVDDVVGWDFVHDVPLPFDTHGHGTHIAGIIGGSAANGAGASGVCPKVRLMALKYYDNGSGGFNNLSNTVRAIEYAVNNGAHIINYSGGGADPAASERAAVALAQKKGVLFVAAAGNDGRNNDRRAYYPASYPLDNVIGVASVNKYERLLPSSNFGRSVHIAAPGLMILSTLPGGKFGTMSGTSQATAFVTGAAALLASQTGVAGFDYRQVKKWVLEGAKPLKLNSSKQLLASGMLSLPGSLNAQRSQLLELAGRQGPEVAVAPPNNLSARSR